MVDSTSHTVLGVVLRARGGHLEVLLAGGRLPESRARRARAARRRRSRGRSTSRRSRTSSSSRRGCCATGGSRPRTSVSPRRMRALDGDWRSEPALPPDHAELVAAAQARLRAKLSYTNVGFALAPGDVHDLGAARDLRRSARARRVGDEPAARARPARGAGARRGAARAGPRGRPPGGALPLRVAAARGDGRVRSAQTAAPLISGCAAANRGHRSTTGDRPRTCLNERGGPRRDAARSSLHAVPRERRRVRTRQCWGQTPDVSGRDTSASSSRQRVKRIWCVSSVRCSVASGRRAS